MSKVQEFLDDHELTYKPSGTDQFNLRVCPFCNDEEWHFFINQNNGLFWCHKPHCQKSGNLFTLRKHLDGSQSVMALGRKPKIDWARITKRMLQYHEDLLEDAEGLRYLKKRKISMDAVKHFKLGIVEPENREESKMLTIPYWYDNEVKKAKYKSIGKNRKVTQIPGGLSTFYNIQAISEFDDIIITEGELDTIVLWSYGFKNVISIPDGADSVRSIDDALINLLLSKDRIFICFDNDVAGEKGAYQLASRLNYSNTKKIVFPEDINDANDFFKDGRTFQEFQELLDTAEDFDVRHVSPLQKSLEEYKMSLLLGDETGTGIDSPWTSMNKIVKAGFHGGDLVILSGYGGVGKTTFALNWGWYLANMLRVPCLFYCLEMTVNRLLPILITHIAGTDEISPSLVDTVIEQHSTAPFYFVTMQTEELNPKTVTTTIRDAVSRYGVKAVFLDNLNFLADDDVAEESRVVKRLKLLSEELDIINFTIAHLRKPSEQNMNNTPRGFDVRGSGMIRNNADFVMMLHRKMKNVDEVSAGEDLYDIKARLILDKTRFSGSTKVNLIYDTPSRSFVEVDHYNIEQARQSFINSEE